MYASITFLAAAYKHTPTTPIVVGVITAYSALFNARMPNEIKMIFALLMEGQNNSKQDFICCFYRAE